MSNRSRLFAVTGGCGFIGSHLSRALIAQGHGVRILDDLSSGRRENAPPQAEFILGDVADTEAVREALSGVDGVFHLAAVASVALCNLDWARAHRTNMGGSITVFEAARDLFERPAPVVWASSAAVYGAAQTMPIVETAPTRPMAPYGADKLSAELHAAAAAPLFDAPNTALRFFNVFGPGQDPSSPYSGVISIFAERLGRGAPVAIYGDGEQSRDFVYVGDVAAALCAAMERLFHRRSLERPARFDAVNVCTGRPTTILGLAHAMGGLLGGAPRLARAEMRGGDIRHSLGDPRKLKRMLRMEAGVSLEEGLRATLESTGAVLAA